MLILLVVLGGLIIALTGREGMPAGDSGGELAMAPERRSLRQNTTTWPTLFFEELAGSKI